MIHVGRVLSDDRAPRLVWRPLETWERLRRAEDADRLALWTLARRELYGLGARDAKWLERWTEGVFAAQFAGVTPAGVIAGASITPHDVFSGDASFQSWHRSDMGVTASTGISEWRASKGAHPTWTASQATTSLQPAATSSDATLNGRASFVGDGSDDYLLTGWNPPAIATQNLYLRAIAKQTSWAGGRAAFAGSSVSLVVLRGTGSSPLVGMRVSSAVGSISMPTANWYRTETFMGGGTGTDWMRVGSSQSSGLSSGNVDASAFSFFGSSTGANGAFALSEVQTHTAEPIAVKRALCDGIEASWYGGVVIAG